MMSPCYQCVDRHIGCHNEGACDRYEQFKQDLKKAKANEESQTVVAYFAHRAERNAKRRR